MASSELPPERPRARLIRTRRGRLIGGVCSGLGAHFGVDPILLRIAFVGLAIFGGVGFWLYLAFLLLVPEEGASAPPLRLRQLPALQIAEQQTSHHLLIIGRASVSLFEIGEGACKISGFNGALTISSQTLHTGGSLCQSRR